LKVIRRVDYEESLPPGRWLSWQESAVIDAGGFPGVSPSGKRQRQPAARNLAVLKREESLTARLLALGEDDQIQCLLYDAATLIREHRREWAGTDGLPLAKSNAYRDWDNVRYRAAITGKVGYIRNSKSARADEAEHVHKFQDWLWRHNT
jgi:hypothetical protein